ncbi:MAG: MarR family transcriptional regulator [Clostridia bacterium]|nr:MarR family transcriptional regulator [Clostridia bacterium]
MDNSKYDGLKLENQLCFPLYAASRVIIKQYHPHLEALGLTYTQYIAMMVFWEKGTISVKELCKLLFLDSGTLTSVLKSLETKGYIRRYRYDKDERVLMIDITDEGNALRERALEIPEKISSCVSLKPEQALQLYKLLYQVLETFKEE